MRHHSTVPELFGAAALLAGVTIASGAQQSDTAQPVGSPRAIEESQRAPLPMLSLGQPKPWGWLASAAAGGFGKSSRPADAVQLRLGLYHSIKNPVVDALGLSFEGYTGFANAERARFGARARLTIPIVGVAVGADHSFTQARTDAVYSFRAPLRRGGVIGRGSLLRVDYLPSRGNQWYFGIELPVVRRENLGRLRPASDRARVPTRRSDARPHSAMSLTLSATRALELNADARKELVELRTQAEVIWKHVVPFLGREAAATGKPRVASPAVDVAAAIARYHDGIEGLFSGVFEITASNSGPEDQSPHLASELAAAARRVLLDEVLLPYNGLLGQTKAPSVMPTLASNASAAFAAALESRFDGQMNDAELAKTVARFDGLIQVVTEQRRAIANAWRDERFAWIPLQLALRAEEHDTQAELDALVSRAVGTQFTDGNFVSYVINEQFQYQLSRTIRAAEEYHVLWTHDFRGVDDVGDPDEMSYRQVLRSYLAAMTARVREYDATGRFPTYMILHDQWYYSVRQGSLFLKFLEDPLRANVRLPREFRAWGDSIRAAQAELRAAIAASPRLRAERERYGDAWLYNLIKVHVSVMNRPDPSVRSWRLAAGMPMTDNIMRDHRKLIFYDISEDDPYRGEALYTGAGVGEHYSNLTWEDRSLLVRGPAALDLKNQARINLLAHRLPLDRLPRALHPRERARDYDARVQQAVAQNELTLRAMSIHNETGYDAKHVNVAKAMLYTLMPSGSVILVPDSFWNAEFWGAALYGAALRGARVLIIAPSYRSNSVEVRGTQLLSRELLWRILAARERDAATLEQSGGMIQVGIFDSEVAVTDIPAKVRGVRSAFESTPWLRALFGFPNQAYSDLERLEEEIARLSMAPGRPREFEHDDRTRLHLKANYFASREAWTIMQRPEWGQLTWSFVTQRIAQVQSRTEAVMRMEETPDALLDIGTGFVRDWQLSVPNAERERVIFYHMMGSQNQNYRSMVMDAEVAFLTAGWPSVIPYLDALSLIGQSQWMQRPSDLDRQLPPMGAFMNFVAHWGRLAF